MTTYLIISAVVWLGCGLLAAGFSFAHHQAIYIPSERNYRRNMIFSLSGIPFGPLELIVVLAKGLTKHGWRLWKK